MAIRSSALTVGRCYATSTNEVRRILQIDAMRVTYVLRGKMAFPAWDKESWLMATKESFALEVSEEVECDCGRWFPGESVESGVHERTAQE
jgi:hypothetical protein